MFAVDDVDDVVARIRSHGAELVGEVAQVPLRGGAFGLLLALGGGLVRLFHLGPGLVVDVVGLGLHQ